MRISKRTREQAALICAMWASGDDAELGAAVASLGLSWFGREMLAADAAYQHVLVGPCHATWRDAYAEAESLLRTGWSP